MKRISGSDVNSLREEIQAGRVKSKDVLLLTYGDGDKVEVLYREGAPYLRAANDTPREISRRHTFARGCAGEDFVSWERRGSYEELYGR